MLILPSVGATVSRIQLNESATKARITFSDGSSTIVTTTNTPTKKSVSKTTVSPNKIVKKKIVVHKESTGMPQMYRQFKTKDGQTIPVPSTDTRRMEVLEAKKLEVIARAKKRAEMLEAKTMDASAKMAAGMSDGEEIKLTT